ncbi:hypothetical protein [Thermocrinis sp.]|jgi:hypothetical protein
MAQEEVVKLWDLFECDFFGHIHEGIWEGVGQENLAVKIALRHA